MEDLVELVVRLLIRVVGNLVGLEDPVAVGVAIESAVRLYLVRVGLVARHGARQRVAAEFVAHGEGALPFREAGTALRENLHHAVGGVGAVQGAGSGALDDFHTLDIFGRDIRQRETGDGAIDDDERIGLARDARGRPQTNGRRRTWLTGNGHDTGAGDLAAEAGEWGAAWRVLQCRLIDDCHRECRILLRRGAADTRYHDLLEVQDVLLEIEVLVYASHFQNEGQALGLVADVAGNQVYRTTTAFRDVNAEIVVSINGRDCSHAEGGNPDARPAKGPSLRRHLAGEDRLLRRDGRGADHDGCEHRPELKDPADQYSIPLHVQPP